MPRTQRAWECCELCLARDALRQSAARLVRALKIGWNLDLGADLADEAAGEEAWAGGRHEDHEQESHKA